MTLLLFFFKDFYMKTAYWFKKLFNINTFDELVAKCQAHSVDCKPLYREVQVGFENLAHLYVLDYNQIEAKGSDLFARYCRGIIIDKNDLAVIARPFSRFFNYQEQFTDLLLNHALNNGNKIEIMDKLDGSIMKLFYVESANRWVLGTRGSCGNNNVMFANLSWYDVFAKGLLGENYTDEETNMIMLDENNTIKDIVKAEQIIQDFCQTENLDKNKTYMFELISPFNENVVKYTGIQIVFLGALDNHIDENIIQLIDFNAENKNKEEVTKDQVIWLENELASGMQVYQFDFANKNIKYPQKYFTNEALNVDNMIEFVNMAKGREMEGFVIFIDSLPKIKMKGIDYVNLHYALNNNTMTASDVIKIVLAGEQAEVIANFPEREPLILPYVEITNEITDLLNTSFNQWVSSIFGECVVGKNYDVLLDKENKAKMFRELHTSETYKHLNSQEKNFMLSMLKGKDVNYVLKSTHMKNLKAYYASKFKQKNLNIHDFELRTGGAVLQDDNETT